MPLIDTYTLILTLFLLNVVLALMLVIFWMSQKTHEGFKTWMLSLLALSCGYFLYISAGSVPAFLSSTTANLLIVLSFMLKLDSTGRYFRSRALPAVVYLCLVPAALLLLWFAIFQDSVVIRGMIVGSLLVPCFTAVAVISIRSKEPETRPLRYIFAAAFFVSAFLWAVIIIRAVITPGDHSLSGPDPVNPIFFIVTILTDTVATASFLMLNMARSQSELKQSEEALSRVNRKLTILASITRHDIKNQLTALQVYLELSGHVLPSDSPAADYNKREMRIARTMGEQIDFTREYEDMGTTAPSWQNVSECVHRAVDSLPMRDVRMEVDRSDLEIYADPMLGKVFYNLIDNALKYGGEKMTTIRVSSMEPGDGLVIVCEDNGTGIETGNKATLFEKGSGQHTGLGLFLSREILSITGIAIAETGTPGEGARFGITVPAGKYRFTGRNRSTA